MLHWSVDPELIRIGPVVIRWYGLLFASGFVIGLMIMTRIFRLEKRPESDLDALLVYAALGTIIGARLAHCFFYDPEYYLANPIDIVKIWRGGLASHGGAAGLCLGVFLYSRKRPDQTFLWLMDRVAIPAMLTGSLIRLGNMFNSEILGLPSTLPWAIVFDRVDSIPRHPVQLYESATYMAIFGVLAVLYRRFAPSVPKGMLMGLGLMITFLARFLLEYAKTRQAAFGADIVLSMGQWLSLPMVLIGLVLFMRSVRSGSRHD